MNDKLSHFEGSSVPRLIAKFAVPTILSQLVTLIYNLADTYFVGQTGDPAQVAALTLSFPIFMSMTMVANLFGIGANSYMSRSLGMKKKKQAEFASTFSFYGAIAGVICIMAVLLLFMDPILYGIGARTADSAAATAAYLKWTVIIGGIPTVSALMMGHLLRAEGNTKKASAGMILGGLLNVVLDYIFVSQLGMGAAGAGVATCISNVVALGYLLAVALKNKNTIIELNLFRLVFIKPMIKQILFIGLPAATIIILGSTANIVLTNQMSAYGDVSIAAFGIVQKFGTIAIQITVGLTQGIMPLLGYHYGAGNMSKVKEINKWAFGLLGGYAALCVAVIELFTEPMVLIFMQEPETVATAVAFARVWILCAPGMCFTNLFCSIFQAMGKGFESLTLSVVRQGFLLVPLLLVLNRLFGEMGLVCSQPAADNITLIIGIVLYIKVIRKQGEKKK